jgi:hypothetical protein
VPSCDDRRHHHLFIRKPFRRHDQFFRSLLRLDTLQSTSVIGRLDEVLLVLERDLKTDYEENKRELNDTCELTTFAVETNVYPDALHIVTRLLAKDGSGRAILYGSRVQRTGDQTFALWSEHG